MSERNNLIYKDNKIINASYKVTLNEQRLILLAISLVNPLEKLTDDNVITVSASEYSSVFGGETFESFREIKAALELLSTRWIKVIDTDNQTTKISWITLQSQIISDQAIQLRFTKEIACFLSDFKGGFTKYELANIKNMKSIFSIRIYELLMQWKKKGSMTISIDDLRFRLEIESKGYDSFGNIKQKIIDPAILEINNTSNIFINEIELIKKGKPVIAIKFSWTFTKKPDLELTSPENAQKMIQNIKNNLAG